MKDNTKLLIEGITLVITALKIIVQFQRQKK